MINIIDILIHYGIPAIIATIISAVWGWINTKKLEKYKSELETLKNKNSFKFTKLHEKRFMMLQELMNKLNQSFYQMFWMTHTMTSTSKGMNEIEHFETLLIEYQKASLAFGNFYNINKLYLNIENIKLIEDYLKYNVQIYGEHLEYLNSYKEGVINHTDLMLKTLNTNKKVDEVLLPIKEQIENNFREILGYN